MLNKVYSAQKIPQKLLNIGDKKYFKKNDIIIHQGDILNELYILIKGKVILYHENKNGILTYRSLLVPPCLMGEPNVIIQEEILFNYECIEDSELVIIRRNALLNAMKTDFDINIFLYSINSSYSFNAEKRLRYYSEFSSENRVVEVFLEFAEVFGVKTNDKIKINYKFSQQFISDLANVKRATTVRTIRKLKDKKIIEYFNGKYYIIDFNLLKEISLQKEFL